MEKRKRHTNRTRRTRRLPVRISYDSDIDYLWAVKFGEAVDEPLDDEIDSPFKDFSVFRRGGGGPVVGFGVQDFYKFEIPDADHELMPDYTFHAPTLALREATAESLVLAARSTLDGFSTPDVVFYDLALEADSSGDPEQAEIYWRACLGAGDPKAHFGLGSTLCELGRPEEAYGHLQEYTRLLPRSPWGWTWLGEACEGQGEVDEAARCYRRAIRRAAAVGDETDADKRLERLRLHGGGARRGRRRR